MLITARGSVEIGELIHRDYPSGHAHPYEEGVHGTGTYDFHPDQAVAESGAAESVAAVQRVRRGRAAYSLSEVARP